MVPGWAFGACLLGTIGAILMVTMTVLAWVPVAERRPSRRQRIASVVFSAALLVINVVLWWTHPAKAPLSEFPFAGALVGFLALGVPTIPIAIVISYANRAWTRGTTPGPALRRAYLAVRILTPLLTLAYLGLVAVGLRSIFAC